MLIQIVKKFDNILKELDSAFHRNMMGDDDGETPLYREVSALKEAIYEIVRLGKMLYEEYDPDTYPPPPKGISPAEEDGMMLGGWKRD